MPQCGMHVNKWSSLWTDWLLKAFHTFAQKADTNINKKNQRHDSCLTIAKGLHRFVNRNGTYPLNGEKNCAMVYGFNTGNGSKNSIVAYKLCLPGDFRRKESAVVASAGFRKPWDDSPGRYFRQRQGYIIWTRSSGWFCKLYCWLERLEKLSQRIKKTGHAVNSTNKRITVWNLSILSVISAKITYFKKR